MVTKTVKSNLKLFKILESMNKLLTTITLLCFSVVVATQAKSDRFAKLISAGFIAGRILP